MKRIEENTYTPCNFICTKSLLNISARVSFWHWDEAVWHLGLDDFSVRSRTCSAHLRCHADKNSRVVNFTGWRAFLFFFFVVFVFFQSWPQNHRSVTQTKWAFVTWTSYQGHRQWESACEASVRALQRNGESYPGTVLWHSQVSVSCSAVS